MFLQPLVDVSLDSSCTCADEQSALVPQPPGPAAPGAVQQGLGMERLLHQQNSQRDALKADKKLLCSFMLGEN